MMVIILMTIDTRNRSSGEARQIQLAHKRSPKVDHRNWPGLRQCVGRKDETSGGGADRCLLRATHLDDKVVRYVPEVGLRTHQGGGVVEGRRSQTGTRLPGSPTTSNAGEG